jgi:hypothetical protein
MDADIVADIEGILSQRIDGADPKVCATDDGPSPPVAHAFRPFGAAVRL